MISGPFFCSITIFFLMIMLRCKANIFSNPFHFGVRNITSSSPSPSNLKLEKLVIIHRHGDRAQIARQAGPKFPESDLVTSYWKTALPNESTLNRLKMASKTTEIVPGKGLHENPRDNMYPGSDVGSSPYAQLTELGAQQLIALGRKLRQRYPTSILPQQLDQAKVQLQCRSTRFCRTLQSIQSLLYGIYEKQIQFNETTSIPSNDVPTIFYRQKHEETLYPQADCESLAIANRRAQVLPHKLFFQKIPFYALIETKIQETLGYTTHIPWPVVKEILTCHNIHKIHYLPSSIDSSDRKKVTEIAGWMWGTLYRDQFINRLGIGRLIYEMHLDLNHTSIDGLNLQNKTCFMYSGHDSTIVPMLCALEVHDDHWPEYAAYIAIEIHRDSITHEKYVRVIYQDKVMNIFQQCDSNGFCTWDLYQSKMKKLMISPTDYRRECNITDPNEDLSEAAEEMRTEILATSTGFGKSIEK